MEEFVIYNDLFDIYGCLLTEKEQVTFKDYYQENYSLSEIATDNNVSRTAVLKKLKKVLEKLNYYESNLHLYEYFKKLRDLLKIDDVSIIKKEIENILALD